MRRLLPSPSITIDAAQLIAEEDRPAPAGRPWVTLNTVVSVDSKARADNGRSGPLGGAPDRALFHALRADADVVLAGAETVRTENYGPATISAHDAATRRSAGRNPRPHLAVVSESLHLDPTQRFFNNPDDDTPPIVVTSQAALDAHPEPARALAAVATLLPGGHERVDWPQAVHALRAYGPVLLVEGGPRTSGQLLASDLVDEVCLTISPTVAGGSGPGLATGPTQAVRHLELARVAEEDGFLLLRYVRPKSSSETVS